MRSSVNTGCATSVHQCCSLFVETLAVCSRKKIECGLWCYMSVQCTSCGRWCNVRQHAPVLATRMDAWRRHHKFTRGSSTPPLLLEDAWHRVALWLNKVVNKRCGSKKDGNAVLSLTGMSNQTNSGSIWWHAQRLHQITFKVLTMPAALSDCRSSCNSLWVSCFCSFGISLQMYGR